MTVALERPLPSQEAEDRTIDIVVQLGQEMNEEHIVFVADAFDKQSSGSNVITALHHSKHWIVDEVIWRLQTESGMASNAVSGIPDVSWKLVNAPTGEGADGSNAVDVTAEQFLDGASAPSVNTNTPVTVLWQAGQNVLLPGSALYLEFNTDPADAEAMNGQIRIRLRSKRR